MNLSNEQNLLAAIRVGDRGAFENAFKTNYQDLCSYAFRYLKEKAASEEIVQEVFVKLWEKRDSLDIKSSLRSYLFRAVHNGALNLIKHVEVREEYKNFNESAMNSAPEGDPVVYSELQAKMKEAIASLPPERRKVFEMSRNEGLKYREIAEKLNISIKTVENQMGKALQHLRVELKDYLPLWAVLVLKFLVDLIKLQ